MWRGCYTLGLKYRVGREFFLQTLQILQNIFYLFQITIPCIQHINVCVRVLISKQITQWIPKKDFKWYNVHQLYILIYINIYIYIICEREIGKNTLPIRLLSSERNSFDFMYCGFILTSSSWTARSNDSLTVAERVTVFLYSDSSCIWWSASY